MRLIRHVFGLLPVRVASSLCYRLLGRETPRFSNYYQDVPLRYAPRISMTLKCGDWAHLPIAFVGVYEPELTRLLIDKSRNARHRLLVDVGANFGYFSLLWAGLHPDNKSIAYEPARETGSALAGNIARNRLHERVMLVAKAVGDAMGEVSIDENPSQTGWSRIVPSSNTRVEMVTLDEEFLSAGEDIEFLKIDAEGYDWAVLKGSVGLLKNRRIRTVVFECDANEFSGSEGESLRRLADESGYITKTFGVGKDGTGLMQCLLERTD
jgi:FkbM family methyltransferase